jgi:hypothetical protein
VEEPAGVECTSMSSGGVTTAGGVTFNMHPGQRLDIRGKVVDGEIICHDVAMDVATGHDVPPEVFLSVLHWWGGAG